MAGSLEIAPEDTRDNSAAKVPMKLSIECHAAILPLSAVLKMTIFSAYTTGLDLPSRTTRRGVPAKDENSGAEIMAKI